MQPPSLYQEVPPFLTSSLSKEKSPTALQANSRMTYQDIITTHRMVITIHTRERRIMIRMAITEIWPGLPYIPEPYNLIRIQQY